MDVTVKVTDRSGATTLATASAAIGEAYHLVVNEGQDAAALVNAQPAGTQTVRRRILVKGGHRLTATLAPKAWTDLEIRGTLDGSTPVGNWLRDGNTWTATGYLPAALTHCPSSGW